MDDAAFDQRLTPARPDLAAASLKGQVKAARYVDGEALEIVAPLAPLCGSPSHDAALVTQALRGERITIYDRPDNGWAWGQLASDGYVGWVPETALRAAGEEATHRITAVRTFAFSAASIKTPEPATLPLGAALRVLREENGFSVTDDGLFIPRSHVNRIAHVERDFVAVSENFVGTPYLWGGKSALGVDCSGLVQVSLNACGVKCPRDSDMQQTSLGRSIDLSELPHVRRGDLLFWNGHVAIAQGPETIVHANAHHMMTVIENMREALARIAAAGLPLLAIKRLF